MLLYGFPETHLMWHGVAAGLADDFTVVCADLRGYGASGTPRAFARALEIDPRDTRALEWQRRLGPRHLRSLIRKL